MEKFSAFLICAADAVTARLAAGPIFTVDASHSAGKTGRFIKRWKKPSSSTSFTNRRAPDMNGRRGTAACIILRRCSFRPRRTKAGRPEAKPSKNY